MVYASADIAELSGLNPINFTVDDAVAISKGNLLMVSEGTTGNYALETGETAFNFGFAGIAAADKEASDGATRIAVHAPGQCNIFDIECGTQISAGYFVSMSSTNSIKPAIANEWLSGGIVGRALEDGAFEEKIRVLV